MTESRLLHLLKRKNVVYITVKNEDYIRTSQIKRILEENTESFKVYSSDKNNPFTRALDLRIRLKSIDFEDADIVIIGFLPQLIWSSVVRHISEKKIIAEMFLSLYDTIVFDRKLVLKKGMLAHICKLLDKKVVKEADLIITDTRADSEYFAKEFAGDISKFEALYLEADLGPINGPDKEDVEPRSVLYFGTGLPLQGTEYVAKAFKVLSSDHGYKCVYIGGLGGMHRKTKKEFMLLAKAPSEHGGIEYHSWMDRKLLYEYIKKAEVCIAGHFAPDIDKADRTIPGKAMIYEALGKGMILGDTRANREFFTSDENHIFVSRGNEKSIVDAVLKLSLYK